MSQLGFFVNNTARLFMVVFIFKCDTFNRLRTVAAWEKVGRLNCFELQVLCIIKAANVTLISGILLKFSSKRRSRSERHGVMQSNLQV